MGEADLCVIRDAAGLACIDEEWLPMQLVKDEDLEGWKLQKWTGAGRDPRITGLKMDPQGKRYISEADSMPLWKAPKEPLKDTGLQGPPVTPEYFEALRMAGRTLVSHDAAWRLKSGVPESGMAARMHTALSDVARFGICIDQLDPLNCACLELVMRYLVMTEAACDRNPRQPDWEGLEVLTTTTLTARGSVELPKFNHWVSTVQRDRAVVLKQGRLLREERVAEAKRRAGKKDDKAEG